MQWRPSYFPGIDLWQYALGIINQGNLPSSCCPKPFIELHHVDTVDCPMPFRRWSWYHVKQSPHPKLPFDVQSFHATLLLSGYSKTPRQRASYQACQSKGLKVLLRSQKQRTDLLLGEVKFLNHIPNKNMSGYIFFVLFVYLLNYNSV